MDKYKIMKQLPKNINRCKVLTKNDADYSVSEESDIENYKRELATPSNDFGGADSSVQLSSALNKEIAIEQVDDGATESKEETSRSIKEDMSQLQVPGTRNGSQLSAYEQKVLGAAGMLPEEEEEAEEQEPAKRTRLVKRTVFFQGAAFIIEEEISIDSDEEESVKTSDDDF